jgi:nitroreductase
VLLELTPDELLSTTRSVRSRLDLTRPVEREVLEECFRLAQQAPNGANRQTWHFVVVTDAAKRAGLADLYRRAVETPGRVRPALSGRFAESVQALLDHLQDVPVHVVPCVQATENPPRGAGHWGSILQATWSFMLAARSRGLGTCWTTAHLQFEREAAELLGVPYDEVMQAALIPVAYTIGTDFKPGPRNPLESMLHWEQW